MDFRNSRRMHLLRPAYDVIKQAPDIRIDPDGLKVLIALPCVAVVANFRGLDQQGRNGLSARSVPH
jgi:hypothetical protein